MNVIPSGIQTSPAEHKEAKDTIQRNIISPAEHTAMRNITASNRPFSYIMTILPTEKWPVNFSSIIKFTHMIIGVNRT